MKTNIHMRRGFTLVELLVVIAIIATLAGVGVPALINKQKEGYRAEAIMNCNQIGKTLFSFDQEYGSFPDDQTATDIQTNLGETIPGAAGKSNYYFRQLIVAGNVDQETPFYCRAPYTKKADNDKEASEMLKEGEVGFAYIMKTSSEGFSSSSNSGIPLVAAAIKENTTDKFDADVYNKKAVVLRIDTSVSIESINADGDVKLRGGKKLLDTGDDTPFGTGVSPVLVAPEM